MEKRLGRGLGALIPEDSSKSKEKVENVSLTDIKPNHLQPRKNFNQETLTDLVNSIKEKGVIQPILLRQAEDFYEIIAGERRWRAAKDLGLGEIPAIIKRGIDDAESLEIALIENIQRDGLNPIEEAKAYKDLVDRFDLTLEQVSQVVGKGKTTVSNCMRLLNLEQEIQRYIEDGKISTGHAKVLLSVPNLQKRKKLAQAVIKNDISVRQLEQMLTTFTETKSKTRKTRDPEVTRMEEELQHKFGTKVTIHQGKKRGKIEIQYYSNNDLNRLIDIFLK